MGPRQEGDSLSEDEVFGLLSNSRRRLMLHGILRGDGSPDLQSLADEIAAEENGKSIDRVTDRERKRAYVSLYQTHVPAMVDAGVVDYDPDSGRIRPKAAMAQLRRYLTPAPVSRARPRPRFVQYEERRERDTMWWVGNAGLAFVGLVGLVGVAATMPGVDPVTRVVAIGLGTLVVGAFSLIVVRSTRERERTGAISPSEYGVWIPGDIEWIVCNGGAPQAVHRTPDESVSKVRSLSDGGGSEVRPPDRDGH